MNGLIFNRIFLNCVSVALILLCLSYWWLGNLPHEIFGATLFLLLCRHVFTNRFWFSNLFRGGYGVRRTVTTALHLSLLTLMVFMLTTSILISRSLGPLIGSSNSIAIKEVHWFAAYWTVMLVGCHIGTNWRRVLSIIAPMKPGRSENWIGNVFMRIIALVAVVCGFWSFHALGLGTKLAFGYSLDFWDFKVSIVPFFLHWLMVVVCAAIFANVVLRLVSFFRH